MAVVGASAWDRPIILPVLNLLCRLLRAQTPYSTSARTRSAPARGRVHEYYMSINKADSWLHPGFGAQAKEEDINRYAEYCVVQMAREAGTG